MKNWLTTHFKNGKFQKDGNYLCSSPFREDRHPSFSISPEKRAWHDFATGEGGRLSDLCAELGIEEPPREGGGIPPPLPSRPGPSEAEVLWDGSSPANPKHGYLQRKRLPADGLRQSGKFLLIPCRDLNGRLLGIERRPPEPDADPKVLQKGPKKNTFFFYGPPQDGMGIVLCEGLATAHAVFQMSGIPAATVFGAAELENGVRLIRGRYPRSEIIVAADADEEGRKAAEQCRALGAVIIEHSPDAPEKWDWWDAQAQDFDKAREQFRAALKAGRAARVEPEPEILEVDVEPQPEPEPPREGERLPNALRLIRADELELTEPEYLVHGVIERDSLAAVFGESGSAKSFFTLDMLCSISTGCTFHGRTTEEAPAVYLCGEGNRAIKRRLTAWEKGRGVSLAGVPLFVSNRAAVLPDDATEKDLLAAVDKIVQATGRMPGVIAFDTLARSLAGDENSNTDMNAFILAADTLRRRYDGCAVVLVHHTGHMDKGRMRGASALRGALDLEILVQKDGGHVVVSSTKQKDAGGFEPMHFSLETVPVMVARNGEDVTSCFLEEMDEAPETVKKDELTKVEAYGLDSFRRAAEKSGTLDALGKFAGLGLEEWRGEFYKGSTADKPGTKRQQFTRAREGLVSKGRLTVSDDVYRLAGVLAGIEEQAISEKLRKAREEKESPGND